MDIKLGCYDLVHSGVVIAIKGNPITIKLPDDIEGDFNFIINFIDDKEKNEARIEANILDKFTLQINFVNFNNFNGGGNTELLSVGTLRKLPLFFNYRVFDLPNASKTLLFNFYVRKEENNGDNTTK